MVIDAQSEQLHGDMPLKRDGKFRQGVLETDQAQTTRRLNADHYATKPELSHQGVASAAGCGRHILELGGLRKAAQTPAPSAGTGSNR
jgi:hypothetical protein